jgi:hypothetical protein
VTKSRSSASSRFGSCPSQRNSEGVPWSLPASASSAAQTSHPTPIMTSRSAFIFTVHDERPKTSHPRVRPEKMFESLEGTVATIWSRTVEPFANVAGGQAAVSWLEVIEQENPFGPVTVPA